MKLCLWHSVRTDFQTSLSNAANPVKPRNPQGNRRTEQRLINNSSRHQAPTRREDRPKRCDTKTPPSRKAQSLGAAPSHIGGSNFPVSRQVGGSSAKSRPSRDCYNHVASRSLASGGSASRGSANRRRHASGHHASHRSATCWSTSATCCSRHKDGREVSRVRSYL